MTEPTLGPRARERPGDHGHTLVGTLDGSAPARVDGGGLVSPAAAAWSIDWWIGADDRWYLPSREPTVRQRRRGAGPVLETTVRIPSGDARQVVYGALVEGVETTVVEIHNESPVPVALALAVRPYTVGPSREPAVPATIELDSSLVSIDSAPAVALPRPPHESGGAATTDLVDAVRSGEPLHWDGASKCRGEGANAVLLYPLPHGTSLRFLVRSPGTVDAGRAVPDRRSAPDAEAVARGWTSVVEAAGRLEFPDSGLTAAVSAARSRLLLAAPDLRSAMRDVSPDAGAVMHGLALGGHGRELQAALDELAGCFPVRLAHGPVAAGDLVAAIAPSLAALATAPSPELLEVAVQITRLVERSGHTEAASTARRGLAGLARCAGDDDGARHLERGLPPLITPELADVTALVEAASPAGSWGDDDPGDAGRLVIAARSLLIDDSGPEVVLLPRFPVAWRGGDVEVHRVPTSHGELSYGIRWHGARPALLWQLDAGAAVLRCPGLDPDWSTTDARGETLLAGATDGLAPAPAPGESFT